MKQSLIMKKFIAVAGLLTVMLNASAQTTDQPATPKKDWSNLNLMNRPNDHLMIQLGYEGWAAKPDSANTKGFPHTLNVYFMFDLPFKSDQRFSLGIGAGISGPSVYFNKTE